MTMLLKKTTLAKRLQSFIQFCILLFLFISPKHINAQITGIVTTTESRCISDGTVKISSADPTSEYVLSGSLIPQLGPFVPVMGMVLFQELPKGNFTITEYKQDNTQPTQAVAVPGNYEQNWIFKASTIYDPCVAGIPEVSISNFEILNATLGQQRPPYKYRISTKGGTLPIDGSGVFYDTTSFPIAYPAGMNGQYELQAKDSCGNYKTIKVFVPQTAPAPNLNLGFSNFLNCAGDAVYKATATGGKPDYIYTIIAPSTDQVGTTQTSSGQVTFNLTSGGTYTIQSMDQCGGIAVKTVTVKPYLNPIAGIQPSMGTCDPLPNGTGAFKINVSADGIGPYTAVITNDCGAPVITIDPLALGSTIVKNLIRPCKYTVTVKDGCNQDASFMANLVAPGPDKLQAVSSITCPIGNSVDYVLNLNIDSLPPYNPSMPYTIHLKDNLGNYLPGYPLTQMSSYHSIGLPPGNYSYYINDACGATSPLSPFTILSYQNPTVTVDVNNICFGAGQAVVKGVNNNPLSPTTYTYSIVAGPTNVGIGPETDSDPNTGKFSSLQSEGIYTFRFKDGCKDVDITVTIPKYSQPTWEVGFGAICPGSTASNLEVIDLQPDSMIVGPYTWRIISENSDIFVSPLPYPSSIGQTSPIFANLPPKDAAMNIATYNILGNDGCKNSYLGSGKVGILPTETLILNKTTICGPGDFTISARVSTPLAGGTYVYYRDGIEVARSKLLYTFINAAIEGVYTAKAFPDIIGNPTCYSETPAITVTRGLNSAYLTQPIGCDNGGTFIPSDDKILFTLYVSGTGSGYDLTPSIGSVSPSSGTYNNATNFYLQPGSVGSGDVLITLSDKAAPSCKFEVTITDPLICDTGDLCLIDADGLANITCNNAGTSGTQADDYTTFTLNPSGLGVSGTYSVTVISGGGNVTPGIAAYGTSTSFHFNNGSATGGAKTIRIQDIGKADCYLDVIVPSAGPCSNCVNPPCVPINVIKN